MQQLSSHDEAAFNALLAEVIGDIGGAGELFPDWKSAVEELFPRYARKRFSVHHERFWDMVWNIKQDQYHPPIGLFLPRGHAKSTSMEMATVLLGAMGRRKFVVYCCETQDRANEHVADNIRGMLESEEFRKHFPEVGIPKVGLYGQQRGWRQEQLVCGNGFTVRALGFDGAMRGIKIEGYRPDLIILDDIDKVDDNTEMVLKKEKVLTKSIIPAKAPECLIIFGQNLIHPQSIATKIARRSAKYLRKTIKIGPVPAIENFTYEEDEDGDVVITGGEPTWPEQMDLDACQAAIDEMGLPAFLTECQQEVDEMAAGSIYPMWKETHNVITRSEFLKVFPEFLDEQHRFRVPLGWSASVGHDWGATKKHPATMSLWVRPPEPRHHGDGLEDCAFKILEVVSPFTKEEEMLMTGKYFGERMIEALGDIIDMQRISMWTMSHEASSERKTYQQELEVKMPFGSTGGARKDAGIDQLRVYYSTNSKKPHPFSVYPEGYPVEQLVGQPLEGRPRGYWVVPDAEGKLAYDEESGELYRKQAKTQAGMKRGRWEIINYHWDATIGGTEKKVPYALDEDVMCSDRYACMNYLPMGRRLSTKERVMKAVEMLDPRFAAEETWAGMSERDRENLHRNKTLTYEAELREAQKNDTMQGNFRLYRKRRH